MAKAGAGQICLAIATRKMHEDGSGRLLSGAFTAGVSTIAECNQFCHPVQRYAATSAKLCCHQCNGMLPPSAITNGV
jgi:hypothetical protein